MTNDIIIADVDRTIEFHCSNLFGHLGTDVTTQAESYMADNLQYWFKCYFLKQCTLCDGNWAATLMSGIQYWMPEVYDAMPERDYSIDELTNIILQQYLIAMLPELFVRICFEELDWDIDDLTLYPDVYDWLFADRQYAPRYF